MSDRLEDFHLLLFLPQDRLAQNSLPQSALKIHIIHKLKQKYTNIMMRLRMTCNISDNVDFRKIFFFFKRLSIIIFF